MSRQRPTPTFYILHGEDVFSLRAAVDKMRAQMGDPTTAELNTVTLDGKESSATDVLSAVRAMPFLSDKRLVIVEGMLSWLGRKGAGKSAKAELETLAEGLQTLPPWARLVFAEPTALPERHPILKLAQKLPHGYHKAFNAPRNLTRWLTERARREYGATIEPAAAVALASVVGENLRAADSELAKLAAYVNGERPISEADVALLTPYVVEANIFEMVDALGRGDGATATRLLHRLLEHDEPLRLFGMIVRQFRLLLLAREHLEAGGTPKSAGQALGVHPYVGEKVARQARGFTLEYLRGAYHFLLETDVGIKSGRVEAVLALDLLIASVAG